MSASNSREHCFIELSSTKSYFFLLYFHVLTINLTYTDIKLPTDRSLTFIKKNYLKNTITATFIR